MILFQTHKPARFSCHFNFLETPYANISLCGEDPQQVLFHLSLRAASADQEALAVCNDRHNGHWGIEVTRAAPLPLQGGLLEIDISAPRLLVRINGQELFRFGTGLRRKRFVHLDKAQYIDFQGGFLASSLNADFPPDTPSGSILFLNDRLELRGTLPAHFPTDDLYLEAAGTTFPVFLSRGKKDSHELRAVPPGRIWQEAGASLELALKQGNQPLATLTLSRDSLQQRAETILTRWDLAGDYFATAQLVEHLRFAGIADRLSDTARRNLFRAAARFRITPFLTAQGATALPPALPRKTSLERADDSYRTCLAEAVNLLREGLPAHELPPRLTLPLDPPVLYVSLSEQMCEYNAIEALIVDANRRQIPGLHPRQQPWFDSGLLPFLYRRGDLSALHEILERQAATTDTWVMMAPMIWTLRTALHDPALPLADRDRILSAFLRFLDLRARTYWDRTPDHTLIAFSLTLLAYAPALPAELARQTEDTILRSYALSPEFWAQWQAENRALPTRFLPLRDAALTLLEAHGPTGSPADIHNALCLLEQWDVPDAPRFRHDLLGVSGLPEPMQISLRNLQQNGLDPAQTALRSLAHPEGSPLEPRLNATLQDSLPGLYRKIVPASSPELRNRALKQCLHILEHPSSETEITKLGSDLSALASPRNHGLGLMLGLGLLRGLLARNRATDAAILDQVLDRALPQDITGIAALPGPAMARARLHAQVGKEAGTFRLPARLGPAEALHLPNTTDAETDPANPLFDTLLVLFSCQPYLDTRLPALRATWLGHLQDLGIPYIIVVGDGQGEQVGDVVYLDAPDHYEGLPQKTLAALRWVRDNTGYAHIVKVDDDCFLNAKAFFGALSYKGFDYYGRILKRKLGHMDRAWHGIKASTPRGRLELDKSAEPSTYCDGGAGYALSRRALLRALEMADTSEGKRLISLSFMEDKLLGDLLALSGIYPADEDYQITIRRRETATGPTLSRWLSGFHASAVNPVKLVHLDGTETLSQDMTQAAARLHSPVLHPPRIWPSTDNAYLGEHSNALEMITPASRLERAKRADVAVVAAMRNEMFMLPHFLSHYRALGVDSFLIADNCSDDGTLEYLAEQPDVTLFSAETDYGRSQYGVAWQQALISAFRVGRWSVLADADELLTWGETPGISLPTLLQQDAFQQANAVRVFMMDLYPKGSLEEADFKTAPPFEQATHIDRVPFLETSMGRGPFGNQKTWTSALRHRLIPGSRAELFVAQKIPLLRYHPAMRLTAGLHYMAGMQLAGPELMFGHFKYNAHFRHKAQAEATRGQHFNNAEEYHKYLTLISEGRDLIYDEQISVRWQDCDWIRQRLNWTAPT